MKKLAIILGVFICTFSFSCRAELICIHPIHLTIKEILERQSAGLIPPEAAKLNIEYLMAKYCAKTDEILNAHSSVPLGDACEMMWADRLGEAVYWAACKLEKNQSPASSPRRAPSVKKERRIKGASAGNYSRRVQCCIAIQRRLGTGRQSECPNAAKYNVQSYRC